MTMPTMTIWSYADECGNVRLCHFAAAAGVDKRTARKWVEAHLIPCRRLPVSGYVVLRADDVEAFIARMGSTSLGE